MAFLFLLIPALLVCSVSKTCAKTSCPRAVKIEIGTNYTIMCTIEGSANDFYWYRGPASDQDLLGKLENGVKSISERYKDDYDVSRSGALVILNAGIIHESRYDLVKFDSNQLVEKEEVFVNITISPDPPCPRINNCTSCNKCELPHTKKSGTLTCKVEGSRPRVPLRWNTVLQNGISVLAYRPQIKQSDVSSDSWDSSVSLEYKITAPCEAKLVLQCVAEDTNHILNSTVLTTEITTDKCNAVTHTSFVPEKNTQSETFPIAAVLLPILFVVSLLVFAVSVYMISKRRFTRHAVPGEDDVPLLTTPKDISQAQQLLQKLKESYQERFCFLKPLPWVEKIHIAEVYTESQVYFGSEKEMGPCISSDELITTKNIMRQKLVIFQGENGDGRTTYLKHVVYKWVKGMEDISLLIYIPLKEVKKDKTLSEFVTEDILQKGQFQSELVEKILRAENMYCLVILDGLKDLPESSNQETNDSGDHRKDQNKGINLTIGKLLDKGMTSNYKNLHVWVSTREADCNSKWCPKSYVKVKMNGFSAGQFSNYVHKCCLFYIDYPKSADEIPDDQNLHLHTKQISKIKIEDEKIQSNQVFQQVKCFLDRNEILQVFEKSPLLITLMVHILAACFTSAVTYLKDKVITDMNTLIRIVIDCMEARYTDKKKSLHGKEDQAEKEDFSVLEAKLGQVALKADNKLLVREREFWDEEVGEDNVKSALEIGLLTLSSKTSSGAGFLGIQFCHICIQRYLAVEFQRFR